MKTNHLIVLLVFAFLGCMESNSDHTEASAYDFTSDSLSVLDVINRQRSDWNEGDIDGFMQGYWKDDDLSFIGGRGVTKGWQATLEAYKKGYPDTTAMGKLTFDILEVNSLSEEWVNVVGKFMLRRVEDNPYGHFSLLFRKVDGNWLIVSDITAVPPSE